MFLQILKSWWHHCDRDAGRTGGSDRPKMGIGNITKISSKGHVTMGGNTGGQLTVNVSGSVIALDRLPSTLSSSLAG